MEEVVDYERPPEEDEVEKPRRQKRVKRVAQTPVRVPWCMTQIWITDDETPDEAIEQFVAEGKCWWLEKYDPEKAQVIRQQFYERVNGLKKPEKRRFKR